MKTRRAATIALFLLAGCASAPRIYSGKESNRLFPDGVYQHDVRVRSIDGKEYGFRGVVRLSPEKIAVAGLGPFGATVFQIVEKRPNGPVEAKIYQEKMAKQEGRLLSFFAALKTLLLLEKGAGDRYRVSGSDGPVEVLLEKRDENGVPSRFSLRHEKFTVTVDVAGYET